MQVGNTITSPGFYAPQGREIRLPLKYPKMLEASASTALSRVIFSSRISKWKLQDTMLWPGLGHEVLSVNAIIANRAKSKFSKDPEEVVDGLIKKILEDVFREC